MTLHTNITSLRALAMDGLTLRQIADLSCMSISMVNTRLSKMIAAGELPGAVERKALARVTQRGLPMEARRIAIRAGMKLGNTGDIIASLTLEQMEWLAGEIPNGSTLAEFCAALLRDLHAEEAEAKDARSKVVFFRRKAGAA